MPGNTFLGDAGPLGTLIAMVIAALVMIIIAFNYNYMINRFPVAGGEFTYTQKAFGKTNAFICSWFLGLSYLAIVPLNGTALSLIGRNLLGNVFEFGFHYKVAEYDIYLGEIMLAVVALALFAVLLLIPVPGLNCSLGKESYICLIVWIALGLVFYLVSKSKKGNQTT